MFVLDVIPLSRTAPADTLSYRSRVAYTAGTVIQVPLRKSTVLAVVLVAVPAQERKAELKGASYMLKGSDAVVFGSLPPAYMEAIKKNAVVHATTIGSALAAVCADRDMVGTILDDTLPAIDEKKDASSRVPPASVFIEHYVEGSLTERQVQYEAHITQALASDTSVLLVVPTRAEVLYWKKALAAYKPIAMTATTKTIPKPRRKPVVIIATPERSLLCWLMPMVPGTTWEMVILERVGSGSYSLPRRPYLDVRRAHEILCESFGVPILYGDYPLPLEFSAGDSVNSLATLPNIAVYDVRKKDDDQQTEAWQVLPLLARTIIKKALESGGTVLLLGVRKGYAPLIVCKDCGQNVTDDAGQALTFSIKNGERTFRSTDGSYKRKADKACTRCGSWNLLPLGVGIERILEATCEHFPEVAIACLSPEDLPSTRKVRNALVTVEHGGIIIGTEALLPTLLEQRGTGSLKAAVVISADSLLSLPFWRARERLVRMVSFMAELSTETVVLTRRPEDAAMEALQSGSATLFIAEERALRRAAAYPPYGTIITITAEGTTTSLDSAFTPLLTHVAPYNPISLPDRPATHAGTRFTRTHVLLLPANAWPDMSLASHLAALPPSFRIRINPESFT